VTNFIKTAARATTATLALFALSGCLSTSTTDSGIIDPISIFAPIPVELRSERNGFTFEATSGGAVYVTGLSDVAAVAYAGVMPGATVGPQVTTGSATYRARYEIYSIENIRVSSSRLLTGIQNTRSGVIPLTADFDSGTITGNSQYLRVNGRISGNNVVGTTTYQGVEGTLDGLIGQNGTVGAFAGDSDTIVYSGGYASFEVTP